MSESLRKLIEPHFLRRTKAMVLEKKKKATDDVDGSEEKENRPEGGARYINSRCFCVWVGLFWFRKGSQITFTRLWQLVNLLIIGLDSISHTLAKILLCFCEYSIKNRYISFLIIPISFFFQNATIANAKERPYYLAAHVWYSAENIQGLSRSWTSERGMLLNNTSTFPLNITDILCM